MPKIHLALCFDLSRQTVRNEQVWLPLVPPGVFSGNDGRTWNNSKPDAVVASFTKKRPFDVEHATHIKGPKGEKAPAIGWILALQNIGGEVWGMVDWNSEGRRLLLPGLYLRRRRYRAEHCQRWPDQRAQPRSTPCPEP